MINVSTVCGPTLQYVGQKPFQSAFMPSVFAIDNNIVIIPGGFSTPFKFCSLKIYSHKNSFQLENYYFLWNYFIIIEIETIALKIFLEIFKISARNAILILSYRNNSEIRKLI